MAGHQWRRRHAPAAMGRAGMHSLLRRGGVSADVGEGELGHQGVVSTAIGEGELGRRGGRPGLSGRGVPPSGRASAIADLIRNWEEERGGAAA